MDDSEGDIPVVMVDGTNNTWEGALHLYNDTLLPVLLKGLQSSETEPDVITSANEKEDRTGASAYVIVVFLVYGVSIGLLAIYHVLSTQQYDKDVEYTTDSEKTVNRYLREVAGCHFEINAEKERVRKFKYSFLHSSRGRPPNIPIEKEGTCTTNATGEDDTETSVDEMENPETPLLTNEHFKTVRASVYIAASDRSETSESEDEPIDLSCMHSTDNSFDAEIIIDSSLVSVKHTSCNKSELHNQPPDGALEMTTPSPDEEAMELSNLSLKIYDRRP